ncbi:MAG: hypothetical protein AMK72_10325, partial [Planctomycetes bacterium SM23_25]
MTGRRLNGLGIRLALMALAASGTAWAAEDLQPASANVRLRGSMNNCRIRFEQEKKGHVAFMGGSITEMNGYRPMVMA